MQANIGIPCLSVVHFSGTQRGGRGYLPQPLPIFALCYNLLHIRLSLAAQPMQKTIYIATHRREQLIDITAQLREFVAQSAVQSGVLAVYAQGATAAIMIQENWDDSVPLDVVSLLGKLIPRGVWLHDKQDGNGDAHLKAGLVGPSESIPVIHGELGLSRWQNVFFCEFDGPRAQRDIVCTLLACN